MYGPTSFEDTPRSIVSPESAGGPPPCASPVGPTTSPSGPAPARANLSARQAEAAGLLTSGTYGLTSTTSYESAALAESLVSKLRLLTASHGSTLYKMTWKVRVTPQQRLIYALRASAPRTSASVCIGWPAPRSIDGSKGSRSTEGVQKEINRKGHLDELPSVASLVGWPTPQTSDTTGGGQAKRAETRGNLNDHVMLAGWVSPTAQDGSRGGLPPRPHDTGVPLSQQATLAGWPTPQAHDPQKRGNTNADHPHYPHDPPNMAEWTVHDGPARRTASGQALTGSSAAMESGGQLNPRFSLWLQGFPAAWANCAERVTRLSSRKPRRS